jgi:hypothetical protein
MTTDGGLERLVHMLHTFCLSPPPPEVGGVFYGLGMPGPRSIGGQGQRNQNQNNITGVNGMISVNGVGVDGQIGRVGGGAGNMMSPAMGALNSLLSPLTSGIPPSLANSHHHHHPLPFTLAPFSAHASASHGHAIPRNPAFYLGPHIPQQQTVSQANRPPVLNPTSYDRHAAYRFSLAFQCVVNIGVRGSEEIRRRVVQAGTLEVGTSDFIFFFVFGH